MHIDWSDFLKALLLFVATYFGSKHGTISASSSSLQGRGGSGGQGGAGGYGGRSA